MSKVVAIGIFDGVHAGHQQIIASAKHHGEVTMITFDPHPVSVVAPDRTPSQLLLLADRIRLLKEAGAAAVEVINFTKEFSQLTADQFIEEILVGKFAAKHVVIGENFNFGFKAQGTPKYLTEVGPKYGFGVTVVKLEENRGSTISSTRIRSLIIDGQIERANELLTRNYYLKGPVIHGEKRGREIGYPTANIGLTPGNDGNFIRISFPALTEDKRKAFVKDVKKIGEDTKVAIRNIRRDQNDKVKAAEKDKKVSEDESKKIQDEIQKITDNFIKEVDKVVEAKEKELLTV